MVTKRNKIKIQRVQTGVRLEKKMLKVLKGLAEHQDLSVGQMLELILMHAFENRPCFGRGNMKIVKDLKRIYKLNYSVSDFKKFMES